MLGHVPAGGFCVSPAAVYKMKPAGPHVLHGNVGEESSLARADTVAS